MAISKAMLSCDGTARTSSKRSARRIAGVAALAFLVAATLGSSIVLAGSSVGSFEIDGNLAPDYATPPAEPIDWLSNPFPASLTTFHDATGQGDRKSTRLNSSHSQISYAVFCLKKKKKKKKYR